MIKTDKEAVSYWNKRFKEKGDVGWGSQKRSKWYKQKKDAIADVLKKGEVNKVLDICCGDCKFIAELPEFHDGSIEYVGIEPTKVIYDQITKEFPDKTFLNITPSELIKTDMNNGQFSLIICYDFLFHIVDDKLYNDFIKWMFNRDNKYIIISYDDVDEKDQRSEEGHYIPRKFDAQSLDYWWTTIHTAKSLEHKSMKLQTFMAKKRPIGDVKTYKPMKRVMITGSHGYIGSNLIRNLHISKYEVIPIDKKINRDILDIRLSKYNPDVIVHLAAVPSISDCEDNISQATKDNVLSCMLISYYAKHLNIPLFFASSQAVKNPKSSVYAYTKYIGEELIRMNNNYVIMRFANVFGGVNFIQDKTSVVAKWIRSYRDNKPLVINGDGNQTRDFVHVDDICRFIIHCIDNNIMNETLDIGTGVETSINELYSYFPSDATVEYDTQSSAVGVMSNVANIERLDVLKVNPSISVSDYLSNLQEMV